MKKFILIALCATTMASGQWRRSNDKLIPYDSTVTVKVETMEVESTLTLGGRGVTVGVPEEAAFLIQDYPALVHTAANSSTGFTEAKNDSIYGWGKYLPVPATLGKITVYTGALTGSAPVRTVSMAVYNGSKALIDTCTATAYVTSNAMTFTFNHGKTVGPGWYYFCFSTYFSTSGTMRFNVVTIDINYGPGSILAGQSATHPVIAASPQMLSAGTGWPSTITLNRSVTGFQFPAMMLWGTTVD